VLAGFPILTTAFGYTGSMFAVEGTLANLYLLYLARKFTSDRTNANARKVFLCSLWYLPALLVALVFHSKNWDKEDLLATVDGNEKNELKVIMEGRSSAPEDKVSDNTVTLSLYS
jgi:protoheme IX farnesyltransferase